MLPAGWDHHMPLALAWLSTLAPMGWCDGCMRCTTLPECADASRDHPGAYKVMWQGLMQRHCRGARRRTLQHRLRPPVVEAVVGSMPYQWHVAPSRAATAVTLWRLVWGLPLDSGGWVRVVVVRGHERLCFFLLVPVGG